MRPFRWVVVGVVGAAIVTAVLAYGLVLTNGAALRSGGQLLATASATPTLFQSSDVVWGRIPYCSCLVTSATDSVASALKEANLTVNLQELSPRDDWLYFAVTFDRTSATSEQVRISMVAGGAEVLEGPP